MAIKKRATRKAAAKPLSAAQQRAAERSAAKKELVASYDGGALPPTKAALMGWTGPTTRMGDGSIVPLR